MPFPPEVLGWIDNLTAVLLAAFAASTWLSARAAKDDAEAWGSTPAGKHWVRGQVAMGVAITLVFAPVLFRIFFDGDIERSLRAINGVIVMALCIYGKSETRAGFIIHRGSLRYRREGPDD